MAFIEEDTAGTELVQAGAAGLGLALFSPPGAKLAFGALGAIAKLGFKTAKVAAKPIAVGALGAGAAGGMYGLGAGISIAKNAIPVAKTVVGGATWGALKAGSWIYKNPGLSLLAATPIGVGAAATFGRTPPAQSEESSSRVEAMGGISSIMNRMNASGDIVLGAHNNR
jgi:hypothetical protein